MQKIWSAIARFIVSRPRLVNWIIQHAERTPYTDIVSPDGSQVYMYRHWFFNRYDRGERRQDGTYTKNARWPWLPSISLHRIMVADADRHFHDHPRNSRTIILRNGYHELRPWMANKWITLCERHLRHAGDTVPLKFGQYHRICHVPREGVYTLFFTWRYRDVWGFLVKGEKVPHYEYLADPSKYH